MNKVILIGNLANDPELKYTPSGVAVCSFRLAVSRNYQNQKGEKEADFIPIIVWRERGVNCSKYLSKGKKAAVSGRIQTHSWEDNGVRHYATEVVADEVVFLSPRDGQAAAPDDDKNIGSNIGLPFDGGIKGTGGFTPVDFDDDELPF